MKKLSLSFILLLALCYSILAKDWITSPNGTGVDCGLSTPCNLQTALTSAKTGDKVLLRGIFGAYRGIFSTNLNGVTITSYPNEFAVIDGNTNLTLATAIGTGYGAISFNGEGNLPDVAVIAVDNENIQIVRTSGNNFAINARGWNGTATASHIAGAKVRAMENILTIGGQDTTIQNIRITDSNPIRTINVSVNAPAFDKKFTGIFDGGLRTKIINCVVDNTAMGIFTNASAMDSEYYGNLLFNNGGDASDGGYGHGAYIQNATGRKAITDSILFGNFGGFGVHVYGSSASTLRGVDVTGNIQTQNMFLIGGNAPADDITVDSNYLFGQGFRFGYGNPDNGTITANNNYVYASIPVEILYWKVLKFSGNKFYQNGDPSGAEVVITQPSTPLSNHQINNNTYINGKYLGDMPFLIKNPNLTYYSFLDWQRLGFDANGTFKGATKPTGQDIFYRPNKYEVGRANVVVFNYAKANVEIDLSKTGLQAGQSFEIRNGLNYLANPITSGVYNGQKIPIDISQLKIAQPLGVSARNTDSLEFQVFVVVPTSGGVSPTPSPTVSVTPTPSPTATPTVTPTPQPSPSPTVTPTPTPAPPSVSFGPPTRNGSLWTVPVYVSKSGVYTVWLSPDNGKTLIPVNIGTNGMQIGSGYRFNVRQK